MKRVLRLAGRLADDIGRRSATLGRRLTIDARAALDRSDAVELAAPGLWSANRGCRMARSADGWIAINLAREEDRELLPAWLDGEGDTWSAVWRRDSAKLVARARLLGLPCTEVGEADARPPALQRMAAGGVRSELRVIDLSSLWAGPLCAGILADMGADVCKIESRDRPDRSPAALDARLNGRKRRRALDFADGDARARLAAMVADADVLVTSARRRAVEGLGLVPEAVFAANPRLVWVAISGHGWGEGADRVAFGDDAAAAGGLVRRTARGDPRFVGDAPADPLTGLAAAAAALEAIERGGGYLVDAALAGVAAWAAAGDAAS